jgi:hypothetical protein
LNFEEPAKMANDPIYADQNFKDIVNSGDSTNGDVGNGNAGDFIVDPITDNKAPLVPVESEFGDTKKDTGSKAKTKPGVPSTLPKTLDEKKDPKVIMPPPIKPADDKNKKPVKPAKNNDY